MIKWATIASSPDDNSFRPIVIIFLSSVKLFVWLKNLKKFEVMLFLCNYVCTIICKEFCETKVIVSVNA